MTKANEESFTQDELEVLSRALNVWIDDRYDDYHDADSDEREAVKKAIESETALLNKIRAQLGLPPLEVRYDDMIGDYDDI